MSERPFRAKKLSLDVTTVDARARSLSEPAPVLDLEPSGTFDHVDLGADAVVLLDRASRIVRSTALARGWLEGVDALPLDHPGAEEAFERRAGAFRVRVGGRELVVVLRPATSRTLPREVVAVAYLADGEWRPEGMRAVLRSLWNLTIVESRVTELASFGRSPQEIAEELGMARGTVHVHMRSVFQKMQVSRQSELVSIVWRSLPRWS